MAFSKVILNGSTLMDITDTTAVAADVASGKYFYGADGVKTLGSASVGGGLEYEAGTWTPASDIARPTITWTNTHTEAPVFVFMSDVTGTAHSTNYSNYMFCYCDPYKLWGYGFPYGSSNFRYVFINYAYRGTDASSISSSGIMINNSSDNTSTTNSSYPRWWVSPTDFHPYTSVDTRYWRNDRTYKWIAVWKPTT